MVSAGHAHTACVTEGGAVYTWGCGEHGQLGHGNSKDRHSPGLISAHSVGGQRLVMVDCGYFHTAAASTNGDVWTWGKNDDAQVC